MAPKNNVLSKGVPFRAFATQYAVNCDGGKICWNAATINTTNVSSEQIRQWAELLRQTLHFGGFWHNKGLTYHDLGDTTGNKTCDHITCQVLWLSFLNMKSELNQTTKNNQATFQIHCFVTNLGTFNLADCDINCDTTYSYQSRVPQSTIERRQWNGNRVVVVTSIGGAPWSVIEHLRQSNQGTKIELWSSRNRCIVTIIE